MIHENVTKDGRTILCEWHTTLLRDAEGQRIGAFAMAQDVTARTAAERQLRRSESLLAEAQHLGYRTYLYFVATDDPAINISRVRNRVRLGGHDVPEDRIVTRYHRSLELLLDAIHQTNRAYVFDNSGDNKDQKHTWLAEITDGRVLELKSDQIPAWFKRAVLDKIR